jgi:hypothetical protein
LGGFGSLNTGIAVVGGGGGGGATAGVVVGVDVLTGSVPAVLDEGSFANASAVTVNATKAAAAAANFLLRDRRRFGRFGT